MTRCNMVDIEDIESLTTYLSTKNILRANEKCQIKILKGGVSNKAILLFREDEEDWVIKQGLNRLRVNEEWYCDPKRLEIEYLAMDWLSKVLKKGTIPKPLSWDGDNYVLGMQAIAKPHANLKELLLKENINLGLIAQMGTNLGMIHQAGRSSEEAKRTFQNRSFFESLRLEAYYKHASNEIKETSSFFNSLIKDTLQIKETIVHGDYSPKNMLVKEGKLILLDHEVMHLGDPAFDVGFALSHLLSKANHLCRSRKKLLHAAYTFWENYSGFNGNRMPEKNECRAVKHTIGCLISRVKGKSPLEYLGDKDKERQLKACLKLIKENIKNVPEFMASYSKKLQKL